MWLINTTSLELESFQECPTNKYAILSHTWGSDAAELTFDEFKAGSGKKRTGYDKIRRCCEQAVKDGLAYAWVDTCCIDKRSSTELSEAINSMFSWYSQAKVCYVFLADVQTYKSHTSRKDPSSCLRGRWFTRGWTLQELIAPRTLLFYNKDWQFIGDKVSLAEGLQIVTGIQLDVLRSRKSFKDYSIAQRMSWASKRKTTRLEDNAYCLIGLFDVNMPLLYGEGSKAFLRLQEMIIERTDDETIFAWSDVDKHGSGLLAPSPDHFVNSSDIQRGEEYRERLPYVKSNRGISIECQMFTCEMNTYMVPLQCKRCQSDSPSKQIAIYLCRTQKDHQYRRVPFQGQCIGAADAMHNAKVTLVTAFIPDSAYAPKIMPHGGLPIVRIDSKLHAWRVAQGELRSLARCNSSRSTAIQTKRISDIETSIKNAQQFECLPERDLESRQLEGERPGAISNPEPGKLSSVQFQFDDLHTDIAFTRSAAPTSEMLYALHLEFDQDFNPVGGLTTRQYFVSPSGYKSKRLLLYHFSGLTTTARPSCQCGRTKFESGLQPVRGRRCPICRQTVNIYDMVLSKAKGCPIMGTESLYMILFMKSLCELLFMDLFITLLPRRTRDWKIHGDRLKGFEVCITDKLPPRYGCVDLKLTFRHLKGLEWQLDMEEQPTHPKSSKDGAPCAKLWIAYFIRTGKILAGIILPLIVLINLTLSLCHVVIGLRQFESEANFITAIIQVPVILISVIFCFVWYKSTDFMWYHDRFLSQGNHSRNVFF